MKLIIHRFCMGANCLVVPMELFATNRQRLCERLRARDDVPRGAVVVLQGGASQLLNCTDRELLFRQVHGMEKKKKKSDYKSDSSRVGG